MGSDYISCKCVFVNKRSKESTFKECNSQQFQLLIVICTYLPIRCYNQIQRTIMVPVFKPLFIRVMGIQIPSTRLTSNLMKKGRNKYKFHSAGPIRFQSSRTHFHHYVSTEISFSLSLSILKTIAFSQKLRNKL